MIECTPTAESQFTRRRYPVAVAIAVVVAVFVAAMPTVEGGKLKDLITNSSIVQYLVRIPHMLKLPSFFGNKRPSANKPPTSPQRRTPDTSRSKGTDIPDRSTKPIHGRSIDRAASRDTHFIERSKSEAAF